VITPGNLPATSGAAVTVTPTTTTTYTLTVTPTTGTAVTATATITVNAATVTLLNHIVFLAQENRSLDHYFGTMRQYWAQNGYPDQSFDGLPQFNPSSGIAPLYGPAPAIPGCDPSSPPPADCVADPNNLVASYHLITQCIENPSPSWDESHADWDYTDLEGNSPAALNGFVWTAGHDARTITPPYNDSDGIRAMGYYDGGDLNYYYFMASNFATSDRWFNPAMSRTQPNRQYLIAATSQGFAYPPYTDSQDSAPLTAQTIFQELQAAGITWKIYVDPQGSSCSGPPYDPACLVNLSTVSEFQFGQTIVAQYPQNIAPISQYFTDVQNGTLPQVAQIEPAYDAGYDGRELRLFAHQRADDEPFVEGLGFHSYL
jgi:phospholipase C